MHMNLISCKLKDELLGIILDTEYRKTEIDLVEVADELGVEPDMVRMMLDQFERLGLIQNKWFADSKARITINVEAHDMVFLGGFTAREEMIYYSAEKLRQEVNKLKSQFPDRAHVFADVMVGLNAFMQIVQNNLAQ